MTHLDLLIARTQRNLTFAYCVLIAVVLLAFLFLPKPLDEATKTLLSIVLTALIALVQQQNSFWFARQRATGVEPPAAAPEPIPPAPPAPPASGE